MLAGPWNGALHTRQRVLPGKRLNSSRTGLVMPSSRERSPDAVAATKRLFGRTWSAGDRRTFARERFEQARLLATHNTTVAREAALKRVAPVFDPRRR